MNCTGGMMYMECGPNCDQTCRAVQPEPCQEECMEGCNCPTVSGHFNLNTLHHLRCHIFVYVLYYYSITFVVLKFTEHILLSY